MTFQNESIFCFFCRPLITSPVQDWQNAGPDLNKNAGTIGLHEICVKKRQPKYLKYLLSSAASLLALFNSLISVYTVYWKDFINISARYKNSPIFVVIGALRTKAYIRCLISS